jgi:hypothetical protein
MASAIGTLPVGADRLVVEDGQYIAGELLGLSVWRKPRTFETRSGESVTETPCDVRLLVGSSLVTVQYRSRDEAAAATQGASDRSRLVLRVVQRNGVKDGKAWSFLQGLPLRTADAEAESAA